MPTNEEERRAAAKKYGLLPEEYKTYENDGKYTQLKHINCTNSSNHVPIFVFLFRLISGAGYGDYPRLEEKPIEQRDVYYPYDFPEMRRNFQEPVSFRFEFHEMDLWLKLISIKSDHFTQSSVSWE